MRIFILVYLIGFILTGIIYKCIYNNDSFRAHRIRLIHQVKKEEAEKNPDIENIDDDDAILNDIKMAMFMSWLGLLVILIAVWGWNNEELL